MKFSILSFFLATLILVKADDVTLAGETYQKFVQYQYASNPAQLKLVSPDCTAQINQTDGVLHLAHHLNPTMFVKAINIGCKDNLRLVDTCPNLKARVEDGRVILFGEMSAPNGVPPHSLTVSLIKDQNGEMKINFIGIKSAMTQTFFMIPKKCSMIMPGTFIQQVEIIEKQAGTKTIIQTNGAFIPGLVNFAAIEESGVKTADVHLKDYPKFLARPALNNWVIQGGVERKVTFEELIPGDKDKAYYLYEVTLKDGTFIHVSGIVLRTASRIYVIQMVSCSAQNLDMWKYVVKNFKEL